jgi:hypothetical protein
MGIFYNAKLNVNHSTPPQSASPLLPPDRKGLEEQVLYVNV